MATGPRSGWPSAAVVQAPEDCAAVCRSYSCGARAQRSGSVENRVCAALSHRFSMAAPGTLTVSVLNCANLASMDWMSKNDPYVQLTVYPDSATVQPRRKNTKILSNGGANPEFMEDHSFRLVQQDGLTLDVAVWESDGDEDYIMDRLNGKVVIALDSIFRRAPGEHHVNTYELLKPGTDKKKVRGSIKLGFSWYPGGGTSTRSDVGRPESELPAMPVDEPPPVPPKHGAPPPTTEAPKPQLPKGWKEMRMTDGDVYYINKRTGETSWTLPAGTEGTSPAPQPAVDAPPVAAVQPEPEPQAQPTPQAGWFYKDPEMVTQGPYSQTQMKDWVEGGFFPGSVLVKAPGLPNWLPLHTNTIRGLLGLTPLPPVPAPAPAPAAPTLLAVTCPQNVTPGQKLLVSSPTGQQLQVEVPIGVTPGMIFHIQL